MKKTFAYRLYPTKEQVTLLEETLEFCRQLYNAALEERRSAWKIQKISINVYGQRNQLPEIKESCPEYKQVYAQVLQDVLTRLDKAFQGFFRRVKAGEKPGYPRFKGKNRYDSFTFPQSGFVIENGRLNLSKIGLLKIKLHRPIEGKIKTLTIRRKNGKWYACFVVEYEPQPLPKTGKQVGIDVGIESFATLSDGTQIPNPQFFRQGERKLKILNRIVAKRKKGSKRRKQAVKILAKTYEHTANQRKDFHHKTARKIVNEFDTIKVENLNIVGMVKNHHLAKSISDVGWGQFIAFLSYKAEYAGREFKAVNPHYTSQICSRCGNIVPKKLKVRVHKCPYCFLLVHRDHNAALNILGRPGRGPQRESTVRLTL